jgi:type II secretory pathway pseudopilin PulG
MRSRRAEGGLTLVEVLVSIVLLTILLVPAMQALQTGVVGAEVHSDIAASNARIASRIEELLSEPFADLASAATAAGSPTVATSYSEAPGTPGRLLVYLSAYDGDNADADSDPFTGTDSDLLWIRVDIEDSIFTLQTLRLGGH